MTATLDPDAARLLGGWAAAAAGPVEEQPVHALRNSGLVNAEVTGPAPPLHQVHDLHVEHAGGPPVPVRVYRPDATDSPVLVYAHGGGWTLLSIESSDTLCRRLAADACCTVVSVGYRLAPEHPFPAAFDDMLAVTSWVAGGGLGWIPERLAVGGDSAGGNLSAAVALHARDHGPHLDLQLLLYPATATDLDLPSMRELGPDPRFRLSTTTLAWFWTNYLGPDFATSTDLRAVPAAADSLAGVARAIVVTPGFDPIKDDGRRYAARLAADGVAVELVEPPTLPHGFAMMLGAVPAAVPAFEDVTNRVRRIMNPSAAALPPLAEEFRRRPFGRHSEDLQRLLHEMRAQPIAGKHFLFISRTNEEWVLGRYDDSTPPVPMIDWSVRFHDLETAEWYVFRVRWKEMFGEELPDVAPPTPVPAPDAAELARQARLLRSPAVLGYAGARSVRAGDRISFFVSSAGDADFDARVVRLASPEIGPIGPPFKETPVDVPVNGHHGGTYQPIVAGSCAHVPGPIPLAGPFTFDVLVFPTLIEAGSRTIAELRAPSGARVTLRHGADDGLVATLDTGAGTVATATLDTLPERVWTEVAVAVDAAAGLLSVRRHGLPGAGVLDEPDQSAHASFDALDAAVFDGARLTLAASLDAAGATHLAPTCFTGKLERPRLAGADDATVAAWDLARDLTTSTIRDTGPHGLDGELRNMPTRGVRGSAWTGDHLTWMADPQGYAAIHFHDTDLDAAAWSPSLELDVPADLASGYYALRLQPADDSTPEFYVPFNVRPAAGAPTADIAFISPTTTYAAYANMHLRVTAQFNELAHGRLTVLDSTDFLLLRMPELGRSTYDVHRDGSPVVYSSMNRPVTNYRPTGRMYKLCLDLMIVDWLDARGYRFDVISDDDIDREGVDALAPYRVVLTGSHPEYISRRQLDAFEAHLRIGGRLMYLGGNGFYSMAEVPADRPDLVEVRRPGQDNLWRVNHAEAASSTSGLPTGMWRNIGRPENALTGVGFITQGFDACTSYTRSAASHDPRVSWIFDGLGADEPIGDFGILQGGAAGYEIDRHDVTKGSPRHSVVVASSSGHSNLYDLMVSSILDTLPDAKRTQDPIRADMVFFETGHGGAVFSVGSIAWAGSLSHAGYANSVSTVTGNVLDRFADAAPFVVPAP